MSSTDRFRLFPDLRCLNASLLESWTVVKLLSTHGNEKVGISSGELATSTLVPFEDFKFLGGEKSVSFSSATTFKDATAFFPLGFCSVSESLPLFCRIREDRRTVWSNAAWGFVSDKLTQPVKLHLGSKIYLLSRDLLLVFGGSFSSFCSLTALRLLAGVFFVCSSLTALFLGLPFFGFPSISFSNFVNRSVKTVFSFRTSTPDENESVYKRYYYLLTTFCGWSDRKKFTGLPIEQVRQRRSYTNN